MKRITIILSSLILFNLFLGLNGFAQTDDVYYTPSNDKGDNVSQHGSRGSQNYSNQSTGNDGYQSDYKLQSSNSYVDSNGNTITNNNYYSDNNYSSRLERFYGSSCGLGYYDYAYTPAYYWGWGGYGLSYDFGYPYYGAYYGWGLGWGMCGYYNPWYSPFGLYGYGYGWGYGYGYGCGSGYGYGRGWYGHGWGPGYAGHDWGAGSSGFHKGGYAGNGGYYFGPKFEGAKANTGLASVNTNSHSANHLSGVTASNGKAGFNGASSAKAANRSSENTGWKSVAPSSWESNKAGNNGNNVGSSRAARRAQNTEPPRVQSAPQGGNYQNRSNASAPRQGGPSSSPQYRSSAPTPSHGNSASGNGGGYHGGYSGGVSHSSGGGFSGGGHSSSGGSFGGGGGHSSGGGGGGRH